MDIKGMVEMLVWLLIDALAAIWLLQRLFGTALGSPLALPLQLMAESLCG